MSAAKTKYQQYKRNKVHGKPDNNKRHFRVILFVQCGIANTKDSVHNLKGNSNDEKTLDKPDHIGQKNQSACKQTSLTELSDSAEKECKQGIHSLTFLNNHNRLIVFLVGI